MGRKPIKGIGIKLQGQADFLVNAGEARESVPAIEEFRRRVFQTGTGTRLLDRIYLSGKPDSSLC